MPDKTTVAGELPVVAHLIGGNIYGPRMIQWHSGYPAGLPIGTQLASHSDATAALAQKDGEIKALREALRAAQSAILSMKVEAETAAQGDEQMLLDACEQISKEGFEAIKATGAALGSQA